MSDKKIVMIVDDDPDDRFFFMKAVEEINPSYECREAKHGVDALEQLRKAAILPDFIFLDLNMQLMDGLECLKELKKDERLKNIPVIIYTTSSYQKDIELTRKLGALHFVIKPMVINKLPGELIKAMRSDGEYVVRLIYGISKSQG